MRKKQRREKKSVFRSVDLAIFKKDPRNSCMVARMELDRDNFRGLAIPQGQYSIIESISGYLHGHEFEAIPVYNSFREGSKPMGWVVKILHRNINGLTLWSALGMASKFALGYNALIKTTVFTDYPALTYDGEDYDY